MPDSDGDIPVPVDASAPGVGSALVAGNDEPKPAELPSRWLEDLFNPLERERQTRRTALHRDPPELLFHYTDSHGLQGIVQSQRLWASNALFLNDATELVHAGSVISDVLESLRAEANGEASRTFIERGQRSLRLDEMTGGLFEVYVACFCADGDLLSQWRGYPPAGGGYALGLCSRLLGERSPQPVHLWRVIYAAEEQTRLVQDVIRPLVPALDALEKSHGADVAVAAVPPCLQRARSLLAEFAFCFKHPSFKEETEWRLVHLRSRLDEERQLPVECRPTPTGFVPYVGLALPDAAGVFTGRLPIQEVVVGPTAHPELASLAVTKLLERYDYRWPITSVRLSEIPLRA